MTFPRSFEPTWDLFERESCRFCNAVSAGRDAEEIDLAAAMLEAQARRLRVRAGGLRATADFHRLVESGRAR